MQIWKRNERKDIKDSVGSCNKHGKTSKETRRTEHNEIESLKQDFKEHHSEYAKQILERVIKV